MRRYIARTISITLNLLTLGYAFSMFAAAPATAPGNANAVQGGYGKLPLSFEANQGQTNPEIKFLSREKGYGLYLTDSGAEMVLGSAAAKDKHDRVRMTLVDRAGRHLTHLQQAVGEEKLPGKVNYILGSDPAGWHVGLPTYAKVRYRSVYPGVDLVYYGNERQLEYDFVVAPGANPAPIRFTLTGERRLRMAANGDLIVEGAHGAMRFHKPVVYQEKDGHRESLSGDFQLAGKKTVEFRLGSYDHSRPLVIDPVLVYATYLGGGAMHATEDNAAFPIAVDADGNTYTTGFTSSPNFPVTPNAFQTVNDDPNYSAFVTKLNPAGDAVVFSTYLGGHTNPRYQGDSGGGIAVDGSGNVFVTGTAISTDFPTTPGAFQPIKNGSYENCFVAELNPTGTALVYSTLLGGSSGYDGCGGIAIDGADNAYVIGSTQSTDFPVTPGSLQTVNIEQAGVSTAFVTKVNPTGTGLVYSTFLGGSGGLPFGGGFPGWGEGASRLALDSTGEAYVVGTTASADFPITPGAFQTVNYETQSINPYEMNGTAFVSKLNAAGTALVYSTFLGGSGSPSGGDSAIAVAIDSAGYAYISGDANSADFPITKGAFQTKNKNGSGSAFVAKMNPTGTGLIYSTFLGGSGNPKTQVFFYGDYGNGIAIDAKGNAYISGTTGSLDFPVTSDATQPIASNFPDSFYHTGFVSRLNATGTKLIYSSFLGGTEGFDGGAEITLDNAGFAYVVGIVTSADYPATPGAFQTYLHGDQDGTVTKIDFSPATSTTSITPDVNPQFPRLPVTVTAQVAAVGVGAAPTGTVTFSLDLINVATVALDLSGQAMYTFSRLAAGKHTLGATYNGDANHTISRGFVTETIGYPSLAVTSAPGPIVYGNSFAPIVVRALDAAGNPLTGQSINFAGSGLKFSPTSAVVDSNGNAQTIATPTRAGSLTAFGVYSQSGISTEATLYLVASKAILSLQASAVYVTYGQPVAQPTAYTLTGFVNGDTPSVVSGSPVLSTSVTSTTPFGSYPIQISLGTLQAANYIIRINQHPGLVHVLKAPLILKPDNVVIHQGGTVPPLTWTYSGFVNGDTAATAVTGTPILKASATGNSKPGVYPISISIGSVKATNYSVTDVAGTITILP